jgi:hypothetical protein
MHTTAFTDRSIALIIWNTAAENDVRVIIGRLAIENENHYFVNEQEHWRISLDEEQLGRIKPVPPELKATLLDADYAINMSLGDMEEQEAGAIYMATGNTWRD